MKNRKTVILLLSFAVGALFSCVILSPQAYADSASDKINAYNLSRCYSDLKDTISASQVSSRMLLLSPRNTALIPNYSGGGDKLGCREFVEKLIPEINSAEGDPVKGAAILKRLGYEKKADTSEGTKKCFHLEYQIRPGNVNAKPNGTAKSNSICAYVDENDKVIRIRDGIGSANKESFFFEGTATVPELELSLQAIGSGKCKIVAAGSTPQWSSLFNEQGDFALCYANKEISSGGNFYTNPSKKDQGVVSGGNASVGEYEKKGIDKSAWGPLKPFTKEEILSIYKKYLKNNKLAEMECGNNLDPSRYDSEWKAISYIEDNGAVTQCFVKNKSSILDSWYVFKEDNTWGEILHGKKGFDRAVSFFDSIDLNDLCRQARQSNYNVAAAFVQKFLDRPEDYPNYSLEDVQKMKKTLDDIAKNNKWTVTDSEGNVSCVEIPGVENSSVAGEEDATGVVGGPNDNQSDPSELDKCMTIGGAMGWIVCPALQALKSTLIFIYDNVIEPLLQIRSESVSRNSGTYEAWSIFRNIANIVFVIILLVVIFSQVTGYGIDNYGIKRMLPRLIVMAILLNFSFIICQLAVDISNILGAGLNSFFVNIANGGSLGALQFVVEDPGTGTEVIRETVEAGPGFFGNLIGLTFNFIGVVAAGALAFIVFTGTGILLSLLVSFLGAMVSVLFMFISLGVRLAGVVILTVLAPLAFVAYALPNTNPLFKKWFNAFKALLLLYPICGLLVGGGQFAAMVLLKTLPQTSGDNAVLRFFYVIIAIMLSVIPFFALPALLKKSISALGGAGATLAGLGARLRGATTSGIRNSESYKRKRAEWNMAGARRGAKAITAMSKFGENSTGKFAKTRRLLSAPIRAFGKDQSRAAVANLAAGEKMNREYASAAATLGAMTDTKNIGDLQKDFIAANDRGDEQAMAVALNRMNSMDTKAAQTFISNQVGELKDLVNSQKQRDAFKRIKSAVEGNDSLSKALATKDPGTSRMLAANGIMQKSDGTYGYADRSSFDSVFAGGADLKDISGLSTDALARAIQSGRITKDMATAALTSNDPALQSGIQSDNDKRQILEAFLGQSSVGPAINYSDKAAVAAQAQKFKDQARLDIEHTNMLNEAYAENARRDAEDRLANKVGQAVDDAMKKNNP